MMNSPSYTKYELIHIALKLTPPLIRKALIHQPSFLEEYGLTGEVLISFDKNIHFPRANLFNAIRYILSSTLAEDVFDTSGKKWNLKNIRKEGELPNLSLQCNDHTITLPNSFISLSPDKDTRLRFFDEDVAYYNLPNSVSGLWRNILSERSLEDKELDSLDSEFINTPVQKELFISSAVSRKGLKVSSLIPPSRRYFERLVGVYDGSASIYDYASKSGKSLLNQLSLWDPYKGFLFGLLLSSHSSMTAEINVNMLSKQKLLRALEFLDKHGDRTSQLGAIEVGLRILPSRPEIEDILIRLIKQIRDDDINEKASGFNLLSSLFFLADGQLSSIKLLSSEPPFYRRLAALSQAALIHRQLMIVSANIDEFSKFVLGNFGWKFYFQSLADMRLEPQWNPDLAVPSQIKTNFFDRIVLAAKKYRKNIEGKKISDLVLSSNAGSIQSLGNPTHSYLPGPLEGKKEGTQNILPPDAAKKIEELLTADKIDISSFMLLAFFAMRFHISADQAELAIKELKRIKYKFSNIENKSQLTAILYGLAKAAAASRNHVLADELRILVRRYRHHAEYALSAQEVMNTCLIAAASHADLDDWTKFVGDWMTELAFNDLEDNEGQVLYLHLNGLCHIVPELWTFCSKADAALMAFNGSRP